MLSIILADSATLAPNCEPFEITLTYKGQPTDYWILRGELEGNYGTLTNQEFIDLRSLYYEGILPDDWEAIETYLTSNRAKETVDGS